MSLASIPRLAEIPVDQLLRNIRLRGTSEPASARLAADLAIRDRSVATLHVLAAAALPGGTWSEVQQLAQASPQDLSKVTSESAHWWAALGRVSAALATSPADLELAGAFFDVARAADPELRFNRADTLACANVYEETGRADQVRSIPIAKGVLEAGERELFDLNALADKYGSASAQWLSRANQLATEPFGLAPIFIADGDEAPFDRVRAAASPGSDEGPLISIIMTTFQRGETLLTAVRSVLAQTWRNWELLLIDDCSGEEHHVLLDKVEGLDERIRVIRREVNEGTYAARNLGIGQAKGDYVTFQDDDDWSHPERLERQVRAIIDDPAVRVVMSYALHFTDSLHVRFGGRRTRVLGSSTLMTRTADLRKVGGFDRVRKSGDTELIRRLDTIAPEGRVTLPEPLAFMRLTEGSLSRSDFGPGWVHPARSEYAEASMAWHEQITPGDYESARVTNTRPFPAPDAMLAPAMRKPRDFDVIIAGDFSEQFFHGSATALFLDAAVAAKSTVGFVHLDTPNRTQPSRRSFIAKDVRRLIDGETVRRILPNDVATAPIVVFPAPETLQFLDRSPWEVTVEQVLLVCDTGPAEVSDAALWSLRDCQDAIATVLGGTKVRLAAGELALAKQLTELTDGASPDVLPLTAHVFTPSIAPVPRGQVPVIGRVGSHDPAHWPGTRQELEAAYPSERAVDVRFLGETGPAKSLFSGSAPGWMTFASHELPVALFIQQLDVYVAASSSTLTPAENRIIHAALASGRSAVITSGTSHPFADAVVTCDVQEVASVVHKLVTDAGYAAEQRDRTQKWLARQQAPGPALQGAMGIQATQRRGSPASSEVQGECGAV